MYRWEIWALWTALLMGLGVLGYTAWTWPSTAELPVAAAQPASAQPAPAPRGATVPMAGAGAATLALLAEEDNASRSLASVAAITLVEPQPESLQSAGEAFAPGTNSSARPQVWGAAPEVVDLRPQAERSSASATGPKDGRSSAVPATEVDLPVFPMAMPVPVPEPFFR